MSYVGTWAVEEPEVYPGIQGDTGLVLSTLLVDHWNRRMSELC